MRTIAILSRKGGAGKTTIAVHLAVAAEAHGIATAVFDLDPQASACLWSDHRGAAIPAVVPAQAPRLPSLLKQAIHNEAKLVILDTAPNADTIASEAANHADVILIPCRPSGFDLDAIGATVRLAQTARKPTYVVINAAPIQGVETTEAISALHAAGLKVCPVVLHHRKAYASRIHEGRTAQEIDPTGKAAAEINALLLWLHEKVTLLPKSHGSKRTKNQKGGRR